MVQRSGRAPEAPTVLVFLAEHTCHICVEGACRPKRAYVGDEVSTENLYSNPAHEAFDDCASEDIEQRS